MSSPSIVVPWSITGILIFLLVIIFLNPDKAQIWASGVFERFVGLHSFFHRRAVTGRMEGTINRFAKSFHEEGHGILPYTLRIEWVKEMDREAFLREGGMVVVRMGYRHSRPEKSLALAMLAFCGKAVVPSARPYLSKDLLRSIDLTTTRKMLINSKATASLHYFVDEVLKPETEGDEHLREQCQVMEILDERGLFARVLLRELQEMGVRLYPKTPDGSTAFETEEFVSFLREIAEKARDEDVELSFRRHNLGMHVMLIARPAVIGERGFAPYLRKIQELSKKGTKTLYICAHGVHTGSAIGIAKVTEKRAIGTILSSDTYKVPLRKGKAMNAVCLRLDLTSPETGS